MSAPPLLILLFVLIIMAFALSFSVGANDETLAPLVGANIFKFRLLLVIGGFALSFGLIFLSYGVGKTIGADILGKGIKYTIFMLLAVLISSIIWLIIGSMAGIPLSSTHCIVGSIFGVLITYAIFKKEFEISSALNYAILSGIIISWFLSPLLGFIIAYIVFKIVARFHLSQLKGINSIEKSEMIFTWLLFISVLVCEVYVGANDGGKIVGILYGLYNTGSVNYIQYYILIIFCGIFLFLGIYLIGKIVIINLASQMTEARPSDGFIVQLTTALVLMICTFLSLPISHSHVLVFAIVGLNIAQKKEVDYKMLRKIVIFWIITFPVSALMASVTYYLFIYVGFT